MCGMEDDKCHLSKSNFAAILVHALHTSSHAKIVRAFFSTWQYFVNAP
jgi:hypothetical protein